MSNLVTFLIPNRGGKDLDKVIKNINEVYSDLDKEIIVIQQDDNLPFMRGQLYNIGVKFAKGNYLALTDNDIYHFRKLPLFLIYENYHKPIIGFTWISQIDYNNGKPIITLTEERVGTGAFNFMRKEDFLNANGFSNLYIGWGAEDLDFMLRFNNDYVRVPQNLGHISHPRRLNTNKKNSDLNHTVLKSFKNRDYKLDGINQTTFDLVSDEQTSSYRLIKVKSISVVNDFKYNDIIKQHFRYIHE